MSSESIANKAGSSFEAYVVATSTEELRVMLAKEPACLADFIKAWVRAGYGVRACNGKFANLLIAIITISDMWRDDPGLVDYVTNQDTAGNREVIQRRVESVFGDVSLGHQILDQDFFAEQTFRELYGHRPLSP